jgi:DNA polymerase-1
VRPSRATKPGNLFGDAVEPEIVEAPAAPPRETLQDAAAAGPASAKRALDFTIVDTPEKLASLVAQLREKKRFCLDLETTALDPLRADIVGWAISWQAHRGFYIAVRGPAGQKVVDPQSVVDALRPMLEDSAVEVTNQNIKYDMLVLRRAGIRLAGIGVDPMVASYLLEAGARSPSLDELSRRYLAHEMIPITKLIGKGLFQKPMNEVDIPLVAEYAVEDAEVAWELAELLGEKLRALGLWDLYWNLERPLIEVLVEMQANGIRVDAARAGIQHRFAQTIAADSLR